MKITALKNYTILRDKTIEQPYSEKSGNRNLTLLIISF